MMSRVFWVFIILTTLRANAQENGRKYPSVFWEITGKNLKKPSYLFGTMHVSNKLVYHLDDTFYTALQNVDMVANEINLQTWQKDISEWDQLESNLKNMTLGRFGFELMGEKSFAIPNYISDLKYGLKREATEVNSILYRNYKEDQDYEENTYLDMYIYQTARRFGKKAVGLENYVYQEMLLKQAAINKEKEREKKNIDMDGHSYRELQEKTEEAYRKGDLDALDSLEQYNMESDAYWELFLYKRNEIHAEGIDSIINAGTSLFAAVGAAHLPGDRGVIEMLRKMGYTLKPIFMKDRETTKKEKIDKIRVPVKFDWHTASDSAYKLKIPGGKFYYYRGFESTKVMQSSDVDNGAYYMITRVSTHAAMLGKTEEQVLRETDSLLYENIPGKIISKKNISNNGYSGLDILNKTKSGNTQRYHIYVTPFEVIIFKMSGIEDYVSSGAEADEFFNSISLKNYSAPYNKLYTYHRGGIKVSMPNTPKVFINNYTEDGTQQLEIESWNDNKNEAYLMLRKRFFYPVSFETDSFDAHLMLESFKSSESVGTEKWKSYHAYKNLPCLDASIDSKDSSFRIHIRCLIKGSQYYMFAVKANNQSNFIDFNEYFSSISLETYNYSAPKNIVDTTYHLSMNTVKWYDISEPARLKNLEFVKVDEENYAGEDYKYNNRSIDNGILIEDAETDEMAYINITQYPQYYYAKKKNRVLKGYMHNTFDDYYDETSSGYNKEWNLKNGLKTEIQPGKLVLRIDSTGQVYTILSDSQEVIPGVWRFHFSLKTKLSSRVFHYIWFTQANQQYEVFAQTDSTDKHGTLLTSILNSIKPVGLENTQSINDLKDELFLAEYRTHDSASLRKCRATLNSVRFGKDKIGELTQIIQSLGIDQDRYFEWKKMWLKAFSRFKEDDKEDVEFEKNLTAQYKKFYDEAGDTVMFKNTILQALAWRGTASTIKLLVELLQVDPPLEEKGYSYDKFEIKDIINDLKTELEDANSIFPALLELASLPDYKDYLYDLLGRYVKQKAINPKAYKNEVSRILFDARIALKRQRLKEEKAMQEEMKKDKGIRKNNKYYSGNNSNYHSSFDTDFDDYMLILFPFYDKNKDIRKFFEQLVFSRDIKLQLTTIDFLLKNGKEIPDTIISKLAANPIYSGLIYSKLKANGKEKSFPQKYINQETFAKALLVEYSGNGSDLPDSMVYVGKTIFNTGKKVGYLYFFKYKDDKKDEWQMAISGLQPLDGSSISAARECVKKTGRKIKRGKSLEEQYLEQAKIQLIGRSASGASFYKNNDY